MGGGDLPYCNVLCGMHGCTFGFGGQRQVYIWLGEKRVAEVLVMGGGGEVN